MSLKEQLNDDLRNAMRQHEDVRRDTLRLLLASVHNAEIAAGHDLDDGETIAVIAKEAKQRRESIEEFGKANRADLVAKEEAELGVIAGYLPQQATREEIMEAARRVVQETGASGARDLGKVMPVLMQQFRGRAEGGDVKAVVRELLGS
jgi:uncharacterized protein YqeY